MLRFRLGDIPIKVRFSHLAVSALLATLMVQDMPVLDARAWPYRQLAEQASASSSRTALLVALCWMLIIFLTVLAHELGHALLFRAWGYRPGIELFWLGGATRLPTLEPLPWHHQALGTAAGPLAGGLLAAGAMALGSTAWAQQSEAALFLLGWLARTNLFWTLFNLLPVPALDGGTLVSTLATRLFGTAGFRAAQVLALMLCVVLVAFGLRHSPLVGILFGLYGLQALRLWRAASREGFALAPSGTRSPLEAAFQGAREALSGERLDEAHQRALAVLESEACDLALASRVHHLLGWVALKRGQGRAALDHFAQVRREPVEAHALAAAFSLLGDEPRALPLWERAWQQTPHPTILHEYAGSLIRSERVQHALRLPGVEPEAAFLCAERPLFVRGAYSEAAAIAEAGLDQAPTVRLAYEAACAHARARHLADAVRLLRRAAELGFQDAHYASSDEDLAALHGHPEFEQWLTELPKSLLA